jgi:hypothetical protein
MDGWMDGLIDGCRWINGIGRGQKSKTRNRQTKQQENKLLIYF